MYLFSHIFLLVFPPFSFLVFSPPFIFLFFHSRYLEFHVLVSRQVTARSIPWQPIRDFAEDSICSWPRCTIPRLSSMISSSRRNEASLHNCRQSLLVRLTGSRRSGYLDSARRETWTRPNERIIDRRVPWSVIKRLLEAAWEYFLDARR